MRAVRPLTDPGDEVALQVEDPQVSAPPVDVLHPLDVLLVQRNLLQGEDLALVVLGPLADQVLCDWMGSNNLIITVMDMLNTHEDIRRVSLFLASLCFYC